tara:strand:- start:1016 stop:1999 length:984 start_codon:yes stop_codon:yes gene_type:complete
MNILVLGAGTFGTAISNELSVNKENNVILFSRNQEKVDEINQLHTNKSCFPNKYLTNELRASCDINSIENTNVLFLALPSLVILESLSEIKPYLKEDVLVVNLSKGLLHSGITIVDSIKEKLNIKNVVTLKGPSFAIELMEHADTLLTLGYSNEKQYKLIQKIIENTSLHIDYTKDIRGVELLSVLKNIYALVIGVVDAKYNSSNTRFMVLTKTFSEAKILLNFLGGDDDTLFLSCGFGDLCMTSLNDLSRNRTLGLLIGKGFFSADYKSNSVILEGLNAIEMFHDLIDEELINELPIFRRLHSFLVNKEKELEFKFDDLIDLKLNK